MILYLVSTGGTQRMTRFVKNWAPELRKQVVVVPYSLLPRLLPLPKATVIFGDIDSLEGEKLDFAIELYRQLAAERPPRMLLNEPGRTLNRYDLLAKLYREGINTFAVRRLVDAVETRFPAFLRSERRHAGTLTPLLRNEHDLEMAIKYLRRVSPDDVLVVEFCDTSDEEGIFRKYSAFRIGQQIIPVHEVFSHYWMQRRPGLTNPALLEEEHMFLRDNPHHAQLLRLFQAAGAEYGRIDYGIGPKGIQTWEINTNPVIMLEPWQYSPGRMPNARRYSLALTRALEEIDEEPPGRILRWKLKRTLLSAPGQIAVALRTKAGLVALRLLRPVGGIPRYAGRTLKRAAGRVRSY